MILSIIFGPYKCCTVKVRQKRMKRLIVFLMIASFDMICHAAEWKYITTDSLGEHYIDPTKIKFKKRYSTANFLLLTNEHVSGTQQLSGKSLLTEYIVYCKPEPKIFNRYKMTSYTKSWGKGKVYDSFMVGTGGWQIDDGKEVEISEFICKDRRLL